MDEILDPATSTLADFTLCNTARTSRGYMPGVLSALRVIPKPPGDPSLIPARADWSEKDWTVRRERGTVV